MRGGSWNNQPRNCRSANRNRNTPDNRNNNNGFRVVVDSSGSLRWVRGRNAGGHGRRQRAHESPNRIPVLVGARGRRDECNAARPAHAAIAPAGHVYG
ncbi:MAG: hypothetical protein L6R00_07800 [Phycisphaerae bacterium]|nr:hypothetical protein [Phycisphaerae bacterium]